MKTLKHIAVSIGILLAAIIGTAAVDWWQNMPIIELPRMPVAHETALRVLDSWATAPGLYDDAYMLAAFVESEHDRSPVTREWLVQKFGQPSVQLPNADQWNLHPVYARVYRDGSVTVWQSHTIIDEPTRGQVATLERVK